MNPQDHDHGGAHGALGKAEDGLRKAVAPVAQRLVSGRAGTVGDDAVLVRQAITIGRPAEELADLLRSPGLARRLLTTSDGPEISVEPTGDDTARWTVEGPLGLHLVSDVRRESGPTEEPLRWRAEPGGDLAHEGVLRLRPAREDWGVELHAEIRVAPPAGPLGRLGRGPLETAAGTVALKALRRCKSLAETGEVPTLQGNPSGRATTTTES
jgi:uncharacterized membrane protein